MGRPVQKVLRFISISGSNFDMTSYTHTFKITAMMSVRRSLPNCPLARRVRVTYLLLCSLYVLQLPVHSTLILVTQKLYVTGPSCDEIKGLQFCSTHLERPARGDDVSSVVDVIPSASQDMSLQTNYRIQISSSDLSFTDCLTALCNSSNLEVAMLHRDL